MCIKATPECKYVQLVQLCNFLQELLAVWAQSSVEHRLSSPELEMKNALREIKKNKQKIYIEMISAFAKLLNRGCVACKFHMHFRVTTRSQWQTAL